jgi:hypothetical protein
VDDLAPDLDERAGIQQQLEALARREAAPGVDLRDAFGAAARQRLFAAAAQLGQTLFSIQDLLPMERANRARG